jgi:predicted small metal-binding protein
MGRSTKEKGDSTVHKHWVCSCGHVVHGDSDDQIVKAAQDHMRRVHGKEVPREDVLKAAEEHRH